MDVIRRDRKAGSKDLARQFAIMIRQLYVRPSKLEITDRNLKPGDAKQVAKIELRRNLQQRFAKGQVHTLGEFEFAIVQIGPVDVQQHVQFAEVKPKDLDMVMRPQLHIPVDGFKFELSLHIEDFCYES